MRLITSTILCIASCFAFIGEAKTIRDIFTSEPDNIFLILPSRTRMDMLDYYDSGNKVAASNKLSNDDTSSQLIDVADNFIAISLTESNKVDLQLLTPSSSDSLVVVVNTVMLPAPDSEISFYDTNWTPVKRKDIFKAPTLKDFIKPRTDKNKVSELMQIIKFPIISYELSAKEPYSLVAHLNIDKFLSTEDWDTVKEYLLPSISYRFNGKKYRRITK